MVDAVDSKSTERKLVGVQVPLPVPAEDDGPQTTDHRVTGDVETGQRFIAAGIRRPTSHFRRRLVPPTGSLPLRTR